MSTEPQRHLVLTGPDGTAHTLWLRELVRDHLAHRAGGPIPEAWAVTVDPAMYEPAGLAVTTNPDIAARQSGAHWASTDLAGVLREIDLDILLREDTTTGGEHAGPRSPVLFALDDPHPDRLTGAPGEALLRVLTVGPRVGFTVAVATNRLHRWPVHLRAALSDATTLTLPMPGAAWAVDEVSGGVRLRRAPLLAARVPEVPMLTEPRFDLATLAALSPNPTGHTLVLGPDDAATAALRDLADRFPTETLRWRYAPPEAAWPEDDACVYRASDQPNLLAMLSGARYAVTDTQRQDVLVIADRALLHLPNGPGLADLLAVLDSDHHHGVRLLLSAPDGEHVPADVRRWFNDHPDRATVLTLFATERDSVDGRYIR